MHARYESSVRDYYEVKEEGWISSLWKYCFINAYGLAWVLGWSWGYEKCEFAIVGSLRRSPRLPKLEFYLISVGDFSQTVDSKDIKN